MAVTVSLFLSILALGLSAIALYQTHFAPFKIVAVAGSITHRIYPIRSGEKRWYISSFFVPLTVINSGAVSGFVTGLRLRLHYPDVKIVGNHEFVYAVHEVYADKVTRISKNRFEWIDESSRHWTPFAVAAKTAVQNHSLVEARWDNPVIQNNIEGTLEIQTDWKENWQMVGKYRFQLAVPFWVTLISGSSFTYAVKNMRTGSPNSECHPPSLHTRTGPTAPMPAGVPEADDAYLDYPSGRPKEDE